jgi:hypothetical protein
MNTNTENQNIVSISSIQNRLDDTMHAFADILQNVQALNVSLMSLFSNSSWDNDLNHLIDADNSHLRKALTDINTALDDITEIINTITTNLSSLIALLRISSNNLNSTKSRMFEREAFSVVLDKQNEERKLKTSMQDTLFNNRASIPADLDTPLTKAELNKIQEFWAPYSFAHENNPEIQRVFSRISGRFDPSYVGDGLMRYEIRRYYHDSSIYLLISHKNFLARQFPDVKQPHTFVCRTSGQYFDHKYLPISVDEALSVCINALNTSDMSREIIIKPADTTGDGQSIYFVSNEISRQSLLCIFDNMESDFICQEVIENHSTFSAPYPVSLNTLRIVTMIWKQEIILVGTVFRMGVDKRVDNISQGGIGCKVTEDGICDNFAVDFTGKRYYKHPSGFKFSGHRLYGYDKAVEMAKHLHSRVPQQKYIAWDITIDKNGDAVFIEMNSPGTCNILQAVGINPFRNQELAREVLGEALINRFFYEKANIDYNYREFAKSISIVKYCGSEEIVKVPLSISNKPVLVIYDNCFLNSNIKEIHIPHSVKLRQTDFSKCNHLCRIIYY